MIFVFYRPHGCSYNPLNPRFYSCDYDDCKYAFPLTMKPEEIYSFLELNLQKMKEGDVLKHKDSNAGWYLYKDYPITFKSLTDDFSNWERRVFETRLANKFILIDPSQYSTLSGKKNEIVSTDLKRKQRGMAWVKKLEI